MSFNIGDITEIAGNFIPKQPDTQINNTVSQDIMNTMKQTGDKFTPDVQDLKFLFGQSCRLIKDNPLLRAPLYKLWKIHILYCIFLYLALAGASVSLISWPIFIIITILFWCIWIPIVWFVQTRQEGRIALMIYKTENNELFTPSDIDMEINSVNAKLREITWATILQSALTANLNGKGGVFAMLVSFLVMAIQEVWDLMRNYLIPAVVIEKKETWSELADIFRGLKTKIPATLVGVFGIDFAGSSMGLLIGSVQFIIVVLGILIGYGLGMLQLHYGWNTGSIGINPTIMISPIPIIFAFLISHIISGVKNIGFNMMKTMYFTLLYLSLNHPEVLEKNPSLKEYLTFGGKK